MSTVMNDNSSSFVDLYGDHFSSPQQSSPNYYFYHPHNSFHMYEQLINNNNNNNTYNGKYILRSNTSQSTR